MLILASSIPCPSLPPGFTAAQHLCPPPRTGRSHQGDQQHPQPHSETPRMLPCSPILALSTVDSVTLKSSTGQLPRQCNSKRPADFSGPSSSFCFMRAHPISPSSVEVPQDGSSYSPSVDSVSLSVSCGAFLWLQELSVPMPPKSTPPSQLSPESQTNYLAVSRFISSP